MMGARSEEVEGLGVRGKERGVRSERAGVSWLPSPLAGEGLGVRGKGVRGNVPSAPSPAP